MYTYNIYWYITVYDFNSPYLNTFIIIFTVELKKLETEGFGVYINKNYMERDKLFPQKNCFSAFVKKDILDKPEIFLTFLLLQNVPKKCMW